MTDLFRRDACDDDNDCHHARKTTVATIIVIVVVIVIFKICFITAICCFIRKRRGRASRPYQGGYDYRNGQLANAQAPNRSDHQDEPEYTGAQAAYPLEPQAPSPPGYHELDRGAPEVKHGNPAPVV